MPIRNKMVAGGQAKDPPEEQTTPLPDELAPRTASELLHDVLKGRVSLGALLDIEADDMQQLLELGRSHYAMGRFAEARKIFQGLVALEPKVGTFHQLAAMALEAEGNLDAAVAAYTQAIHLFADGDESSLCGAYLSRGSVHIQRGDNATALIDLTLAKDYLPPDPKGDAELLAKTLRTMTERCAHAMAKERD